MRLKFLIGLLLSLLMLGGIAAYADSDGTYVYSVSNNVATITGVANKATFVGSKTIPEKIGGYTVTTIQASAFKNCTSLTSIVVPDSVTSIGNGAFQGCNSLEELTMPKYTYGSNEASRFGYIFGYTTKEARSYYTDNPYTVTFPQESSAYTDNVLNGTIYQHYNTAGRASTEVNSTIKFYGYRRYYYYYIPSSLKKITITKDTIVPAYAFSNCNSLTTIVIPKETTSISSYSFYNCAKCVNIEEIILNTDITEINGYAFYNCKLPSELNIPNNVVSIGSGAFSNCSTLTGVSIPDSYTGELSCFSGCENLTRVQLGNKITSIGGFSGCSKLQNIVIPDSVTSISSDAFKNCTSLTNITIPGSVTSIGRSAFEGCTSLTSVYIGNNVATISEFAFKDCTTITQIVVPNNVTSIESGAFQGCTSLTEITIPKDTYGENQAARLGYIFGYTTKRQEQKNFIPSVSATYTSSYTSGQNIMTYQNYNSTYTKTVGSTTYKGRIYYYYYIPASLKRIVITNDTSINTNSFYNLKNVTDISLNDEIVSMGNNAFYNCTGLTNVTIPESVTSIGASAFASCTGLTNVTIPESVTSIGASAFAGCTGLARVDITDISLWCNISFTNSESNPLYHGKKLYLNNELITDLIIPDGITTIKAYAFYNCTGLTNVTIPESVTSIGASAFAGYTDLTSVYYNGTAAKWNTITIGTYNDNLNNATKHYFAYVTLTDKNGAKISYKIQDMGSYIDTNAVVIPEGYGVVLYTDKECHNEYEINTPIAENLTLYVDFIKLNVLEFEGTTTADIGEQRIVQKVSFATDKKAKYFSCNLKVSNALMVQEIKSDIFEIEQYSEIIDNATYYYLFLVYNGDGNIPTYKAVTPFEMVLDVLENAVADEILSVEILDDSSLANDDGNSYNFAEIKKAEIKINPILTEEINITGLDEINVPTQYAVTVLPKNTTKKEVVWTVSDETTATISENGILIPVKKGTVTIKATAKDGSGVYAEKTVSVNLLAKVNSISSNIGMWNIEYSEQNNVYTIYVPESTTSIRLTAKHDGTLKGDGLTLPSNVARTVTLSNTSDETSLDLTYTCDGYADNNYTITIVKFEGTKTEVSEDKKSFTITPINVENGKTVILALYDADKFVEMQSAVYTGEAVPFTTTKTYTNAKVVVWNGLTKLKPVCEVEIVK